MQRLCIHGVIDNIRTQESTYGAEPTVKRVSARSLQRVAMTDLNREKDVRLGCAHKGIVTIKTESTCSLMRPIRRRSELILKVSSPRQNEKETLTFCYRTHKGVREEVFDILMKTHSDRQYCGSPSLKKAWVISRCSPARSFACPRRDEGWRWTRAKAARRTAGSAGPSQQRRCQWCLR